MMPVMPYNPYGWSAPAPSYQMPPQMMTSPVVAIHCTFGEKTLLLAQSVKDCESVGGTVHEDVKKASEAQK